MFGGGDNRFVYLFIGGGDNRFVHVSLVAVAKDYVKSEPRQDPSPKRTRVAGALEDGNNGDPLVAELARSVSAAVDRRRGLVGSSTDSQLTVREARQ